MDEEKRTEKKEKTENSIWEWIVAGIGFLLVAGAIGATFYRAETKGDSPPTLEVTVDSVAPSGKMFLAKFTVKNTGGQTAAAVAVEGELKNGTESAETAQATLTYAPSNSSRRGGLYFTKNPKDFDLQIRVTGYEEP